MRHICVHDENKIARRQREAVAVRGAEAHLTRPALYLNLGLAEDLLQLHGDLQRIVWRVVFDDDNFVRPAPARNTRVYHILTVGGARRKNRPERNKKYMVRLKRTPL